MPSPFDESDAAAQAAIDEQFGEGIRIIPMNGDQNYGPSPDGSREIAISRATVSRAPKNVSMRYPESTQKSAETTTLKSEAWIDRSALSSIGYEPRRGDIFETLDDEGQVFERFTVNAVHPGENGDLMIELTVKAGEQ